jgi:hypothetical protein
LANDESQQEQETSVVREQQEQANAAAASLGYEEHVRRDAKRQRDFDETVHVERKDKEKRQRKHRQSYVRVVFGERDPEEGELVLCPYQPEGAIAKNGRVHNDHYLELSRHGNVTRHMVRS